MPQQVQTVSEFTYAGPFATSTLIAVGIGLVVLLAALGWWEARRGRKWILPLLWVLRLVAVAAVLWMLAEPTILTLTRRSKPKTFGLLIDTSASMDLVDPPGDPGDDIRWSVAAGKTPTAEPVAAMDQAAALLKRAETRFRICLRLCRTGGPPEKASRCAEEAWTALKETIARLEDARAGLANPAGGQVRDRVDAVHADLTGNVRAKLSAIAAEARSGKLGLLEDRQRRFDDLDRELTRLSEDLSALADTVAARSAPPAGSSPASDRTRLDKVAALIRELRREPLGEMTEKARMLTYRFDGSVWPCTLGELESAGAGTGASRAKTDLSAALEQIATDAAGGRIEGVLLISDGDDNTGRDPVKLAAALPDVPVFVVAIGSTRSHRDVFLHHVQGPPTVFKDDKVIIEGRIDTYDCIGEELSIELLEGKSVIEAQRVSVPSTTFFHSFSFTRKAGALGKHDYRVRVTPVEDERDTDNNSARLSVNVVEGVIRVLLVDQLPRWEYRYLRNLFDRDKRIEFTPLLIEPSPRRGGAAEGTNFPRTLHDLGRYSAVILGDVSPTLLTKGRQQMLEQYVDRRGGTLIVIAGTNWMPRHFAGGPVAAMLPIRTDRWLRIDRTGYDLYLTPQGRMCPALLLENDPIKSDRVRRGVSASLPIYSLAPDCLPKATSSVLIAAVSRSTRLPRGERGAFLSWQYYGKGRVAYIAAPMTYRLRFEEGDRYHHRFWGQLLRWAISRDIAGGSKTVQVVTDKTRYTHGDPVQVTVALRDMTARAVAGATPRVTVHKAGTIVASSGLKEDEGGLGAYRAAFKHLAPGQYTLRPAGAKVQQLLNEERYTGPVEAEITIDPRESPELRSTRCNLPLLKKIAAATGGMLVQPTAAGAVLDQLDLSPEISEQVSRRPLWTRWALLWIFLGCLTMEWILRKVTGLA